MTSVEQNFDRQRKENSIQLHDKLANILERFEETRQAIKDNVKMLENISDTTASIDSSAATRNDTIDSTASCPYSYSKLGRSMSGNKLSGVDGASGTNYGLRTISSVDSGVMLTLTSSSEAGTQSRTRSFGSWTGTTSPMFLTHAGEADNEGHVLANNRQNGSQSDSSDDSDDEDAGVRPISSHPAKDVDVFSPSVHVNNSKKAQDHRHSRVHENNQSSCTCNTENTAVTFYEDSEDDFEVQEQTISFEDEEDGYHVLSPLEADNHSNSATYTKHKSVSPTQARTCIVLPPVQKEPCKQRPSSLSVVFRPSKHDEWMERDHFSVEKNNIRQAEEDFSRLERTWSSDSRLMFSPIPEESPTELTPRSDGRRKGIHRQTNTDSQKPTLLTVAQVHHSNSPSPTQRNSQVMMKPMEKEDGAGKKSKKFRHKRKKAVNHQQPSPSHIRCVLSSSTSSGSSVQDGVPRSDVISLSSYRNAIDQHAIALPQVPEPELIHRSVDSISSASSTSSFDFVYSSSSSSGCTDSEYDFEVSRQADPHQARMPKRSGQMVQQKNQTRGNKETTAPVLRKLCKEKLTVKTSDSPAPQNFHKPRLFKKNSSSPKLHSKLMKTKSDEASHSLLRYFRFPSPPRTAVDENSDNPGSNQTPMSHRESTPSRSEEQKSSKEPSRRAHRSKQKGNITNSSLCSCATSTTTDTASEIAYPDLCQPKNRPTYVVVKDTTANSKTPQIRSAQPTTQTKASQTGLSDAMTGASSVPVISSQVAGSTTSSLQLGMPAPSAADSNKNYTLHVQPSIEKVKKKRSTFFNKIFRKQKTTKSQGTTHEIPLDSKLTLDLTGGEVRVRSSTAESIPYVMVAHPNPNYPPPRTQPVQPYPIYRPYLESADVRTARQAPVYVVPADQARLPGRDEYLLPHHRPVDMPIPAPSHYPYVYADERNHRRKHSHDNSYYRTQSSKNHFDRSQSSEHLSRLRESQHNRDYLHMVKDYDELWRRSGDRGVVRYYNHPNNQTVSKMQGTNQKQPPYHVLTQRRKYYQIL